MNIKYSDLRDKILGCWNGKNIGGVLGAPYEECQRSLHDVKFYQQDLYGNPPGNDDLDLQLVWLNAAEKHGKKLNSHILADYWMEYIVPNWSEYGMAKRNIRAGMLPPLSGAVDNRYKDSNGAWIRTEIWACLAPGHPDLAVKYAIEDAIVDHADEGVYAAVFCAAVESAAFVCDDKEELIKIGLSYIPEDCITAKAVKLIIDCKKRGLDYKEARAELFNKYPGTFGVTFHKEKELIREFPDGEPGMDAPNAIGIIMIGWLYGEDDFEKTLCITVNCGEDADCTAGTIGAILGIMHGNHAIPEKWLKPINGVINTCCIDLGSGISLPKTADELTDRVIKSIPVFLDKKYFSLENAGIDVESAGELMSPPEYEYIRHIAGHRKPGELSNKTVLKLGGYAVRYELRSVSAVIDYIEAPSVSAGETRKIRLILFDPNFECTPGQWANVKIYTDDGVQVAGGNYLSAPLCSTYSTRTEFEIELFFENISAPSVNVIFDISVSGRTSGGIIKAVFNAGHYTLI